MNTPSKLPINIEDSSLKRLPTLPFLGEWRIYTIIVF